MKIFNEKIILASPWEAELVHSRVNDFSFKMVRCVFTSLTDIDECANNLSNMSCAQECTNTPGSFQCSCNSGFSLNSDKRSCDGECFLCNICSLKRPFPFLKLPSQTFLLFDFSPRLSFLESRKWTEVRATRAAQLLSLVQPIISSICCTDAAVAVVVS